MRHPPSLTSECFTPSFMPAAVTSAALAKKKIAALREPHKTGPHTCYRTSMNNLSAPAQGTANERHHQLLLAMNKMELVGAGGDARVRKLPHAKGKSAI